MCSSSGATKPGRRATSPQSRSPTPFDSLTKREQEVLSYLVAGRTYPEIAAALFISEKTVSTHVSHVLRKPEPAPGAK
ncbi:response regulator transcription factor [Kribbella sp. NBC_00889]|uniref:response regulator transcription factor n=1 Tax=Kribbella sp. NBC_00889 TaxID=2975974 RepID=UPI00386A3F13